MFIRIQSFYINYHSSNNTINVHQIIELKNVIKKMNLHYFDNVICQNIQTGSNSHFTVNIK